MSAVFCFLYVTIAGAVCAAMLLATWRSHRSRQRLAATSSSLAAELIWALIPWLMMLAAVAPTALESIRHPG
jgi:heme/copper-type cytochrome/quinol oxidase subunit 2